MLRAVDFDAMLLRHPGEVGIAIDHWAALVLEGDEYSVLSVSGKPGSVVAGEGGAAPRFSAGEGAPGIWLKEVVDGAVRASLVAPTGRVCDILRPATAIVSRAIIAGIWVAIFQECQQSSCGQDEDPRVATARLENPAPALSELEPQPEPEPAADRTLNINGVRPGERPRLS